MIRKGGLRCKGKGTRITCMYTIRALYQIINLNLKCLKDTYYEV